MKLYSRRQMMAEAAYLQQWTITEYATNFSPNGENFLFGGFSFRPQAGDVIEVKVDLTEETVSDSIFLGSSEATPVDYGYKFSIQKNGTSPRLRFVVGTAYSYPPVAKTDDNTYLIRWDNKGVSVNGVYIPGSFSSYVQQVYNRYNRSQGEKFYFNGNVRKSKAFFHYIRYYKKK